MPVEQARWVTGSCHSPHARLMTNKLAYQVLEAVYHCIPAGTRGGPLLDDPLNAPRALLDYQAWLHQRLRASGLAKALAGGPDFLPDISFDLPPFWRSIARLTSPRNYRRLAEQVLRNLAWYLGDGSLPATPAHKLRSSLFPALVLTATLIGIFLMTTELGRQPWPVVMFYGMILLAIEFIVVCYYNHDTSGKLRANCAELYAYLLEAYAEPGADSANLVQSLLEQLGRGTDNSREARRRRARRRGEL